MNKNESIEFKENYTEKYILIIKNSSLSFETSISSNQELTFDYISKALEENNININENNIKENLHFTANQKYTNLGLLFSDQNPFTFKLAVYQSNVNI